MPPVTRSRTGQNVPAVKPMTQTKKTRGKHQEKLDAEITTEEPMEIVEDSRAEEEEKEDNDEECEVEEDEDDEGDEEEGFEEEDDGEEEESDVSVGEDIRVDFDAALSGDLNFRGSYAFGATFPEAPNPCISIDGLGTIGIPLSIREAQAIIGRSKQAPFGHGKRTVVDKKVRDTWEIEPRQISFENPAWDQYMAETIVPLLCQELGVAPSKKPPKAKLHKMLLYEAGSHFLPHQDTVKTPGMFATIIIILPSVYTGGEVHVSHSNARNVFDFASSSLTTISVLSWYTDVRHEVKPITSGYRWALSYNLIHTSSGLPPAVPSTDISELAYTLKKWRQGAYANAPKFIAYILDHEYSKQGLCDGFKALNGKDCHKVRYIKQASDEQGFSVCFGNLHYTRSGVADDEGGYHGRYPTMGEVCDIELTIQKLVDFDGTDLLEDSNSLELSKAQVVPKKYFKNVHPDSVDYEPYTGNEAGSLDQFYRRTVAVVIPQSDVKRICASTARLEVIVEKLARTRLNPPSEDNMVLADAVIMKMELKDTAVALTMHKYALLWKEVKLWRNLMEVMQHDINFLGGDAISKVGKAVNVFQFQATLTALTQILTGLPSLADRMKLIESIRSNRRQAEKDVIDQWCKEKTDDYLQGATTFVPGDVPILIGAIKNRGSLFITETFVPSIPKFTATYTFWDAWLTTFIGEKAAISSSLEDSSQYEDILDQSFKSAFSAALSPQEQSGRHYYSNANPLPQHAKQTIALVMLSLKAGLSGLCESLFNLLLDLNSSYHCPIEDIFRDTYIPVIQELRRKPEIDLRLPVFTTFLRNAIVLYLQKCLGAKPPRIVQPRSIGCGCTTCAKVDQFIFHSYESAFSLYLGIWSRMKDTKHVRSKISAVPDLISVSSFDGQSVNIQRSPLFQDSVTWTYKQRKATEFLVTVFGDSEVKRIMGRMYDDVLKALKGEQAIAAVTSSQAQSQHASSSTSVQRPVTHKTQVPAKRKRPPPSNVVFLGVMEITDDDS